MTEITLSGYSDTTENVVTATDALVDGDKYVIPTTDSKGNQLVGSSDGSIKWILASDNSVPSSFAYSVIDNSDSSESSKVLVTTSSANTRAVIAKSLTGN
tara:strand:- start:154 stop:453 length:300 start_codon:yes stop_codon:yes gene_type:complete